MPLILSSLLALPPLVWGHAQLVRSDPKAGVVLTAPPQVVRTWFDDELDPDHSTIGVSDARGQRVDDGHGGVDLNDLDRKSMIARLRAIGAGTYTVRWRAVSANDGFVTQGSFAFIVRR